MDEPRRDFRTYASYAALSKSGWNREYPQVLPGDRINCKHCGVGTVKSDGFVQLDISGVGKDGSYYARWCPHYQEFLGIHDT